MPTSPVMIGSANALAAIEQLYPRLQAGLSAVDACVDAATIVEDDLDELTVGFGGLPNCDGVVELDAAVMDGRTHRAGAVAAMQNIRNPAQVAKLVLQQTRRVLLAGEGAKQFAIANGFREENLLSETARRLWLLWKRSHDAAGNWIRPAPGEPDYDLVEKYPSLFKRLPTGTVHIAALDSYGNVACATSTSGHAFKLPGRVGDSPIVGAGLYADNAGGTCGSVGFGEANMLSCTSFAVVHSLIRQPELRLAEILRKEMQLAATRVSAGVTPPADFDLRLFSITSSGEHAGLSYQPNQQMAVADTSGVHVQPLEYVSGSR